MNFATSTHAGAHERAGAGTVTEPGLSGVNNAHAGAPPRETSAQQPDPLAELRDDLDVVLRVLAATSPVALVILGRKRGNKFVHALEAAQREVRRALEATGAGRG